MILSKEVYKGKTTNGLMRHIRDKHKTNIKGTKQKQELLNMGYYHGYKALRYIKERKNDQQYSDFEQIKYIYNFDNELKKIFYPTLIKIETSLKNRLIDYLVPNINPSIEYIYSKYLTDYTRFEPTHKKYKKYLKRKLDLRSKIDETIAYHYGKRNPVISHFFHNSKSVPLWAYFEVISFGEFGNFMYCLHKDNKIEFTDILGINHSGMNQNGRILENIIFTLTFLRNSVMHNLIIFDCRFNKSDQSGQIKQYLENMTGVSNIQFKNIEDFLVLIVFLLKNLNTTKKELNKIPRSSYFEILGTDVNNKIIQLKIFAKK